MQDWVQSVDWTDILAIIIAAVALYFAVRANYAAFGGTGAAVMALYFEENRRFHDTIWQYKHEQWEASRVSSKRTKKERRELDALWAMRYEQVYESYYNAIDYACCKYRRWQISRRTFREVLGPEVVRICTDPIEIDTASQYGIIATSWDGIREVFDSLPTQLKVRAIHQP